MSRSPSPPASAHTRVVIAGGGWAGLAAAVELASHGIPPTVIESARQVGGRARAVRFGRYSVDNGQHLLIGAYREILRLLGLMGIPESRLFARRPMRLKILGEPRGLDLRAAPLPAPLHLAWGLLTAHGLSLGERLQALRFSLAMQRTGYTLSEDISVAELLRRHRQSPRLCLLLWEPLCLGALNTHLEEASARLFLRVLGDSFSHSRHDSDLLIPRTDLGHSFPLPAIDYLEAHGGKLLLGRRVTGLAVHEGAIAGIWMGEEVVPADHVILALPPVAASRMLQRQPPLEPVGRDLAQLQQSPIVTVYLQYPASVRLPTPMIGMSGTLSQWVFDRHLCDQPGLLAVVISGDGPHIQLGNDALAARIIDEMQRHFPHLPTPQKQLVIRERRATFRAEVGVESQRPGAATAVQGCWLAGDYTATGYPATLEGAVRSGVECARRIIEAID